MPIVYNYNLQIDPPAPLVNLTVRSPERPEDFVTTPALLDTGADFSVITNEIFEKLKPLRAGEVYVEDYRGEGDVYLLYSVDFEIHEWHFRNAPVLVGASSYVILGRDLLNKLDIRLNGIDGKFEILR